MPSSMTGYGRGERAVDGKKATVEIKSVNHRYLEVNVKSGARLFRLDDALRKVVKGRFTRGYFDLYVALESDKAGASAVSVNEPLLAGYMEAASQMAQRYGVPYPPRFEALVGLKDLFTFEGAEADFDLWWPVIEGALEDALVSLDAARRTEGKSITEVIGARFDAIAVMVAQIVARHDESSGERLEKLKARIVKLVGEAALDEGRLIQEVAYLVDKAAIAEEVDRLGSHLKQVESLLADDGPIGRKLEFFVQEINREVNTIGSKTSSSDATALVVEIKSELEKIREQSQNVE
ncbi:MAG: YicC family protein [Nitrospinae bacterium]|nr:YicC family protein [Nitrospinota bacterium]